MSIFDTYFYFTFCILFILDIVCFSLFEQQVILFLFCFYITTLYGRKNFLRLLVIGIGMGLESSLYFGSFGLQLVYLIPATIIGIHSQRYFYNSRLQPYLFLLGCLLIQYLLLEPMHWPSQAVSRYTPIKIIANIIVLWCMSLINNSQGKLGNRLNGLNSRKEESPDS